MTDIRKRRLAALALAPALFALATPAIAQQDPPDFAEVTAATSPVADAYFRAYIALDWDALEPLLGENASFKDPTAEHVFGGKLFEGKDVVAAHFRQGYANVSQMSFAPLRVLHAGNYGIYEGELTWKLRLRVGGELQTTMPFTCILRVEDGKVVEHRDYGDYTPFIAALEERQRQADEAG